MVPGEICAECSERSNHHHEMMLSAQKSAEAIVVAAHREIVRNTKGM